MALVGVPPVRMAAATAAMPTLRRLRIVISFVLSQTTPGSMTAGSFLGSRSPGCSGAPGPGGTPLADPVDDEPGVVAHKADQRRPTRVLVVHAQKVQARGRGHATAVDRRPA